MKKLTLINIIFFIAIISNAQTDEIYPIEGEPIRDCKITEVRNGNIVYYIKNFHDHNIEAVAIIRNGNYTALSSYNTNQYNPNSSSNSSQTGMYRGHDYSYYQKLYKRAQGSAGFGSVMTVLGLGGTIAGTIMTLDDKVKNDETAEILYIAGAISFNIGLPVWISSAVIAANNKRAMEMTSSSTQLSFGITNNGVGLVFNF